MPEPDPVLYDVTAPGSVGGVSEVAPEDLADAPVDAVPPDAGDGPPPTDPDPPVVTDATLRGAAVAALVAQLFP